MEMQTLHVANKVIYCNLSEHYNTFPAFPGPSCVFHFYKLNGL